MDTKLRAILSVVEKNVNRISSDSNARLEKNVYSTDGCLGLQMDASDSGLGYMLSQINKDGEEHHIAFGSRKLLPREQKYSAIERDALAIVSGICHFRTYLEGTKFEVQTDHNPLIHMPLMKDSHGLIGRWHWLYNPLTLQLNIRAGAANNNADGLSPEHSFELRRGKCQEKPRLWLMDSHL